jgi:folate-binding Fe-S cluster repair protein YgfZ
MGEHFPASHDHESDQPPLLKSLILDRLFVQAEALCIDIDEREVAELIGEDDNDFLGNLTTLALVNNLDPEELFYRLGIAVESDGETE